MLTTLGCPADRWAPLPCRLGTNDDYKDIGFQHAREEVVWFLYLFDVDVSKLLLFQLGVCAPQSLSSSRSRIAGHVRHIRAKMSPEASLFQHMEVHPYGPYMQVLTIFGPSVGQPEIRTAGVARLGLRWTLAYQLVIFDIDQRQKMNWRKA